MAMVVPYQRVEGIVPATGGNSLGQYPVLITDAEKKTMDWSHVGKVVARQLVSPATMGGVSASQLTPTLMLIEERYRQAKRDYESALRQACDTDGENLTGVSQKAAAQKYSAGWTPVLKVVEVVVTPFLLVGGLFGYKLNGSIGKLVADANELITLNAQREQSANRRAWLQQVDILEKRRLTEMREIILLRLGVLVDDIKFLKTQDEYDMGKNSELVVLRKIYAAVFPGQPQLVVKGEDIDAFIQATDSF